MVGTVTSRFSEGAGKTSNLIEAPRLHPNLDPGLADCKACLSHKVTASPLLTFNQACLSRGASCLGSCSLSQQGCGNILDGSDHRSRQCWHPVHMRLGHLPTGHDLDLSQGFVLGCTGSWAEGIVGKCPLSLPSFRTTLRYSTLSQGTLS